MRSGTRKAWAGVALCQAAAVYAWPGIVVALAGIQIATFVGLNQARTGAPERLRWRWFVANAATAMLLFQLTAPCFPQVVEYLSAEVPSRSVGWYWLANELRGLR